MNSRRRQHQQGQRRRGRARQRAARMRREPALTRVTPRNTSARAGSAAEAHRAARRRRRSAREDQLGPVGHAREAGEVAAAELGR